MIHKTLSCNIKFNIRINRSVVPACVICDSTIVRAVNRFAVNRHLAADLKSKLHYARSNTHLDSGSVFLLMEMYSFRAEVHSFHGT